MRKVHKGGKAMATDKNRAGAQKVRKFQNVHHAKAKEEPRCRFHALIDKVWRLGFEHAVMAARPGPAWRHSKTLRSKVWRSGSGNYRGI